MGCIDFDFKTLSCSSDNRQRLSKIYKDVQSSEAIKATENRLRLCSLLASCAYDPGRGLYVPLSNDVYLTGKLQRPLATIPAPTVPIREHFYTYFTNPLVIPEGHHLPDFDIKQAPAPQDRLTNAGWLVVTVEFDWDRVEEFDENLRWLAGKNGKFSDARFAEVDNELKRHQDYRGFCAVYSGRRSVHIHFLYNTEHLEKAPWNIGAEERNQRRTEIALVMQRAHGIAYGHVVESVNRILQPSREPDFSLNSVQWRRAPFGVRELEKDCDFLGLKREQRVPQIVLQEQIRERKPKDSIEWLLDPYLSASVIALRNRSKNARKNGMQPTEIPDEALEILRQACEDEWGAAYPRATAIGFEGGDAVIHFANHSNDRKPSSIIQGDYRRLLIRGENAPEGNFFLPGNLTANEIVSWAMEQAREHHSDSENDRELTPEERAAIIARERQTIAKTSELYLVPEWRDRLIVSVEGAGKTSGLLASMRDEMLDRAMSARPAGPQLFMCYAARSRQQAREKREEFEREIGGGKTVLLESFWEIYQGICLQQRQKPIERSRFKSMAVTKILAQIRDQQLRVFDLLEAYRKNFWKDASYDCGLTMIFTTKATVATWQSSRTKIWLHPAFDLEMPSHLERSLAGDFGLGAVAFDELEQDEFLHTWPDGYYKLIKGQQEEADRNWADLQRDEKLRIYSRVRPAIQAFYKDTTFERFDADMRVDLSSLEEVRVNYDEIPFGSDNSPTGMYRGMHGTRFHLGTKDWLFARWENPFFRDIDSEPEKPHVSSSVASRNFLTTERLMAEVVRGVYRKKTLEQDGRRRALLKCQSIEPPDELFPIAVDLFVDKRAHSKEIEDLAREITDQNPNAFVVSDGVDDDNDRVLTFQKAKGANYLKDRDIYIIVTHLHSNHYAQLNVVGQWLGIKDVIDLFYRDQISQAVGRNRGFRDTGNGRKTVVVTNSRLAHSSIFEPSGSTIVPDDLKGDSPERGLQISRSARLLMGGNEFASRTARRYHIDFRRTKERPW